MDQTLISKIQYLKLAIPPKRLRLVCGRDIGPIQVAYETYGELSDKRDNAILILHALTGDSHAAGKYSLDDRKSGWWDGMIGPGKAFDTNKYYIICSNILGGCKGTTGPNSINPETGREYGLDFPIITIKDMVNVQKLFLDKLGIERLYSVAGGSLGGMQALEWIISYPEMVRSAIIIAATAKLNAQGIAFDEVARNAIITDPNFNNGNYYHGPHPDKGLGTARMIGHITYLSDEKMREKFGRNLQNGSDYSYDFITEFQVESYLAYQGRSFVERFDANSLLYLSKAMDYFDLSYEHGSLDKAFERVKSKLLLISFTSDWLFPPYQAKEMVKAFLKTGKDISYMNIKSFCGHDAFLIEIEKQTRIIKGFLKNV